MVGTNARVLSLCLFLLRGTVGVVLFMTGAGKVFGWFGGFGMAATLEFYAKSGFGAPLAYLSIYTELIGGVLLVLGLLTRPAAFAVMINMLVATISMWPRGFIVGGAAFPFSFLVSAIIILLAGPMAYSVDAWLMRSGEAGRGAGRFSGRIMEQGGPSSSSG